LASQGFDDPDSSITQGTIQIRVGSGPVSTITIDSTNDTLEGLAEAVNNAKLGVTATIVNDGSDSRTQPYRLLLFADQTGSANAISITNNLAADNGDARRPELTATYIGPAVTGATFSGTSTPTSNAGAGGYTGSGNDTYSFTVVQGGTVGVSPNIQISFADGSGENTGTITLGLLEIDVFKDVAEGLQVKFAAGTLVAGDSFTVDVTVPTVQQASNASVSLGSGAGALIVESSTNQMDGLIRGVTLDLHGADSDQEVELTIAHDTENARQAITDFVESYNSLLEFIDEQVRYEVEGGVAGVLLGNRSAITIQDQVRRVFSDVVANVNPLANRLSAVGITTNRQGRLEIDSGKLDDALAGGLPGVSLEDVHRLFSFTGQSTSGGIRFVTGGTRTRASATPYQVDVSQAAERARITATNALAASTVITDLNNTITLTIDGKASGTITLANGTYTRLSLAQELEAQIHADELLAGRRVSVSLDADRLVITSDTYGSISEATVTGGSALASLGFVGTETDKGQDVVGKFVVDGVDEPAVGKGQLLIGSSSNAHTADLQVRVTFSADQILPGAEAELTVVRGIASKLDVVLTQLLDPVSGRLDSIDDSFQEQVDDLDEAIDHQTELLEARRQALLRQFVALETTVGQLRSLSEFLTNQLAFFNTPRSR
jgi:flagellar capping protein FliD